MSGFFCVTVLKCVNMLGNQVTSSEPDEPAGSEDDSDSELKLLCGDTWRLQ